MKSVRALPEKGRQPKRNNKSIFGTFYSTFIRPERGAASVVAEVDSPSARINVAQLLSTIEQNQHAVGRGRRRPEGPAGKSNVARHRPEK